MPESFYLFIILALLSEVIGTVSGFGSSILFVPVASLFFDFKTVLGITAVFHVFSNIAKIMLFRSGIDLKIALKLGIPAVLSVLLGAWITTFLPTKEIELFMNFALLGLSIYLLINFNKVIRQNDRNLYTGGVLSGFLAGLTGTGGAIRGITLASFQLTKDIFIATSALIDLGVDAGRAVVYLSNGYFDRQYIILIPFLLLISALGSYTGKVILRYTSEKAFRILVLSVILITTVLQMIKFFSASSS